MASDDHDVPVGEFVQIIMANGEARLIDYQTLLDLLTTTGIESIKLIGAAPSPPIADTLYVGSGRLVLLSTASASNDATIDFTGLDDRFDRYLLTGTDIIPITGGAYASLRISIAGAFKSGANDYSWGLGSNYSNGVGDQNDSTAAQIRIGQQTGNSTGESLAFHAWIPKVSGTSLYKNIYGMSCDARSNGTIGVHTFGGRYDTGIEAIDGIQFRFEADNVASGEFALYGLEKV